MTREDQDVLPATLRRSYGRKERFLFCFVLFTFLPMFSLIFFRTIFFCFLVYLLFFSKHFIALVFPPTYFDRPSFIRRQLQ